MNINSASSKLRIQLVPSWWKLVKGIDEQKFVNDVQKALCVQHKHTITRRTTYSTAERKAVEKLFTKYGVETDKIWITLN